jgi:hypothetical protein
MSLNVNALHLHSKNNIRPKVGVDCISKILLTYFNKFIIRLIFKTESIILVIIDQK